MLFEEVRKRMAKKVIKTEEELKESLEARVTYNFSEMAKEILKSIHEEYERITDAWYANYPKPQYKLWYRRTFNTYYASPLTEHGRENELDRYYDVKIRNERLIGTVALTISSDTMHPDWYEDPEYTDTIFHNTWAEENIHGSEQFRDRVIDLTRKSSKEYMYTWWDNFKENGLQELHRKYGFV